MPVNSHDEGRFINFVVDCFFEHTPVLRPNNTSTERCIPNGMHQFHPQGCVYRLLKYSATVFPLYEETVLIVSGWSFWVKFLYSNIIHGAYLQTRAIFGHIKEDRQVPLYAVNAVTCRCWGKSCKSNFWPHQGISPSSLYAVTCRSWGNVARRWCRVRLTLAIHNLGGIKLFGESPKAIFGHPIQVRQDVLHTWELVGLDSCSKHHYPWKYCIP